MSLQQYSVVRVQQLLHPPEHYNGWGFNRRPPFVGDMGYIVDILHAPGLPDHYIVECSDTDGASVWLGDFLAEELDLSPRSQVALRNNVNTHTCLAPSICR